MNNQILPAQLIQFIKGSKNPSQAILEMMESRVTENPLYANLLTLAKNGDEKGVENIARNILKEQGRDYDKEFNGFKNFLGIK